MSLGGDPDLKQMVAAAAALVTGPPLMHQVKHDESKSSSEHSRALMMRLNKGVQRDRLMHSLCRFSRWVKLDDDRHS